MAQQVIRVDWQCWVTSGYCTRERWKKEEKCHLKCQCRDRFIWVNVPSQAWKLKTCTMLAVSSLYSGVALEDQLHSMQKKQYRKEHEQARLNLSSSDSTFSGNCTISYFSVQHYIISPAGEHACGRLRNKSQATASDERDMDQQMLPFQKVSVDQLSAPKSVSADERVRKHVREGWSLHRRPRSKKLAADWLLWGCVLWSSHYSHF